MFEKIFEYYNLSNYDTRPGAGITMLKSKILGKTVGDETTLGDIYDKFTPHDDIDEGDEELEDVATRDAIAKKISQPVYAIDPKRSDLSNTSGGRRQGPGLNELAKDHTNPIRKNSIAPYKQRKFDGPPIGTGNASNIYRTRPGRKSGTVFGWSRAPIVQDNSPLFFGEEVRDKMEIAFLRQQKNVNRIRNLIKEIEKE